MNRHKPLLRRTRLKAKAPLKSGGKLRRRARLAPMNRDRLDRLWAQQYGSEDYVAFIHDSGCAIPGCGLRPIQAAHARSRGSGGTWRDLVGLCVDHHAEQHTLGVRTFAAKYGIDLGVIARVLAGLWMERVGADPTDTAPRPGPDPQHGAGPQDPD